MTPPKKQPLATNIKPLKILHILFSRDFGGAERYAAQLANMQHKAGAQVRFLVRPQNVSPNIHNILDDDMDVAQVSRFLQKWQVQQHIKSFQPDVIHSHLGKASRLVGSLQTTAPSVATLHILYREKDYAGLDGLICINPEQMKSAKKTGYRGQLTQIGNWVMPAEYNPTDEFIEQLRTHCGADEKTFLIGTLGRLHEQKGVDVLIKAFRKADLKKTRLVVVGDGPEEVNLHRLAENDARITFFPSQHTVEQWYHAFDLFVSASRYESFGLTLVEAMQAGTPILATNTIGAQIVLKGQAAKVIPLDNVDAMADMLTKLHKKGRQRETYKLTPFDPAKAEAKIDDFYAKLIK